MGSSNSRFLNFSWFVLVMVFLVILAGGIVRMTQSGMGCPDWPRCFGMWIPPIHESQLPSDFAKYLDQQDIDHSFNVYHTWIEYVNRLLGALLGVIVFIYFIWSFIKYRRKKKIIVVSTLALVLITGFQGFLGKLVVDANLSVVKVTIHMLVAIIIAAIPAFIIAYLKGNRVMVPKVLKTVSILALMAVLIQIVIGTQVREEIDIISKALNYQQRELWIDGLDIPFYIHRSFSWLILALCGYLWWKSKEFLEVYKTATYTLIFVAIAMIAGLVMNFFDMPAIAQPIHLLVATLLSVNLFYFRVRIQ